MSIENKKGKEESREKLIQELQDLGQLIAPNDSPSSETESPSEPAPLLAPLSDAFDGASTETTEVEVPEGPATVDMFVADDPPESTLPITPRKAPPHHPQGSKTFISKRTFFKKFTFDILEEF